MNHYMFARRLLSSTALVFLLTVSAVAQLSREVKRDVLRGVDQVVTQQAFVPGVDLKRWPDFLSKRQEEIDAAETSMEFTRAVNGALREFGISHIRLNMASRSRAWSGGEQLLLQRQRVSRDSARWVSDDVAMIRINSFATGYSPDTIEQIFEKIGDAKALILDLRSNGGGLVENMHHLLAHLLPTETPIGTFVSKRTADEYIRSGKGVAMDPIAIANWTQRKFKVRSRSIKPFAGEVIVLQDQSSASASEIVASALRESKGSTLIGTRSAGAVLMSTFQRLPHGYQIQYPISDYVSIKGMRLEGNPLRPDIELSLAETRSEAAVQAALTKLGY